MLTKKQMLFCENYAADPCATRAAQAAGYSQKTAYSIGQENLKKPEVVAYIKELQESADTARIASINDIKTFWTQIMHNEENRLDHRLKASEMLMRASGGFITEIKAEVEADSRESHVLIYLPEQEPDPEVIERMYPDDEVVILLPDNKRPVIREDQ